MHLNAQETIVQVLMDILAMYAHWRTDQKPNSTAFI
jgi:hypothetical protein